MKRNHTNIRESEHPTSNIQHPTLNLDVGCCALVVGRWIHIVLLLAMALLSTTSLATPPEQQLAAELANEGQFDAAAVEYRRLALKAPAVHDRSGYYWGAAYAYFKSKNSDLSLKMLDHAEDASEAFANETMLLRMECALQTHDSQAAGFYAQSLIQSGSEPLKQIAQSRKIGLTLQNRSSDRKSLNHDTELPPYTREAIQRYAAGNDKNPKLGGFFGMVPGLGYAYAGEYANALRSLILNGLFIYGMVDTAEDESWGAFSIITFFEMTWYSGSIYGGIDASHRYNQNRLQASLQMLDDHSGFRPNLNHMPAVVLKYQF